MYYSAIGFLAILILLIENQDILLRQRGGMELPAAWRVYRRFLFSVLAYYATDVLWGVIGSLGLPRLLFADTTVYFLAMAVCVLFWTQYTVTYLNEDSAFGRFLMLAGRVFCVAAAALTLANVFTPLLFTVDADCAYTARPLRYVLLAVQILLLLLLAVFAFSGYLHDRGASGKRYRTIALFGVIMALFLTIQLWFPLLPLYSIAFMLGISLLHSFVVNDEKEAVKEELRGTLLREQLQHEKLKSAIELAYTDPLTGAKNKHAFIEAEERLDSEIDSRTAPDFAALAFDLNDLKRVNDTQGHEVGDHWIVEACRLIGACFHRSDVYRIGGDEFAVIAQGPDFEDLDALLDAFEQRMAENAAVGAVVLAAGCARYDPLRDNSFSAVLGRADEQMYIRKHLLKSQEGVN